ncbi:MAG: 50S ribosomal protein L15 [Candidatus Omnitrophica bacterium]|nr:50S ribosomal protein L15 [Candidatus Omnitrophota bacterium]
MLINQLRPRIRQKRKKRVGRGSSSGHGKTSTRGHKGHKARTGRTTYLGFAGGQTRLMRKLPKVGFNVYKKHIYQIVSLEAISKNIKKEIEEITPSFLKEAGLIKSDKKPVKILSDGKLSRSFVFKGCKFSANAIKKVEEAGGKIVK